MPLLDPEKYQAYQKAYREKNRERLLKQKKAWYQTNKERIAAEAKIKKPWRKNRKPWDSAKYKAYYEKHREQMIAKTKRWIEQNQEKRKAWEKARHLRLREDANYRKDAVERMRVWMMENRERYRETQRRAKVRRKSRLGAAILEGFTQEQLDKRIRLLGRCCVYCGGAYQHLDHLIPVASGGRHALWNLAPACRTCNTSKGDTDPMDWVERKAINKTAIMLIERAMRRHMRLANAA